MNLRRFLLIAITFIALHGFGQIAPGRYYVQFTDKNNSPYSLEHPEAFLTQRAIDRRANQGIDYDIHDLPVNPQYLNGVADAGAQIISPTKWMNGVVVETTDQSVIDAINALPYVQSVRSISGETTNNEKPYFKNESAGPENRPDNLNLKSGRLSFDYGYAYEQINLINGVPLHEAGYRGEGMVIAVIDAGFDYVDTDLLFDSLRNDGRILGTKDFVTPGGNVYQAHYHGRMVLSTMAANIPGLMIGTAPKASYWLLRSENAPQEYVDEEYYWVSAAEFADSVGADVINSSLGYTEFDDPAENHTYADMDGNTTVVTRGADMAAAKGILVVNSAGNSGSDPWFYIGAPADGDSVFTIGAVDNYGNYASFSSKGPTSDGRIKPNVVATGLGTTVSDGYNGVTFGSGTSFSSPIIAGMSACLWQAMPDKNNMEIQDAIMHSASQYNNPDSLMGFGVPNYQSAWWILTSVDSNLGNDSQFVKVYPNPFNNYVYLKFSENQTSGIKIKLVNMVGQVIYDKDITGPIYKLSFDGLSDKMSSGLYFLEVSDSQKVQTVKLIKR